MNSGLHTKNIEINKHALQNWNSPTITNLLQTTNRVVQEQNTDLYNHTHHLYIENESLSHKNKRVYVFVAVLFVGIVFVALRKAA